MPQSPTRLLLYILALVGAAVAAFVLAVARSATDPSAGVLMLAALLGVLAYAARLAPLPLAPHTKLFIDTAPLVATALVLPAPLAVAVAALAIAGVDVVHRTRWFQVAFNGAEAALRMAAGTSVYGLLAAGAGPTALAPAHLLLVASATAVTMHLVNITLVTGVVSLQRGRWSPAAMLRRQRAAVPNEAGLAALGVLAAVLVSVHPWFMALLLVPALAVYRAFRASLLAQDALDDQAHHDGLTGLANRTAFTERAAEVLARARARARPVTVLFLDLDGFKTVNDTRGHGTGDALLAALAHRLAEHAGPQVVLARFGGDEFTALVENCDADGARALGATLLAAVGEPTTIAGHTFTVGASIGIACAPDGRTTTEELLRNADIAMYHAKAEGKGRCALFLPAMAAVMRERVELEGELREALRREALVVHYQPEVELGSGRIIGSEALVRWPHPVHGLIPPARFIPLAEDSGLIVALGRWVLREACRQTRRWQEDLPGAARLMVSVNLSVRQLAEPGLVAEVAAILAETGLAPADLVLEVTESAMIRDAARTLGTLQALKRLGVQLALDDFGTGYSSLSYLDRFPFDLLKIDKAFVDPLGGAMHAGTLARTIILMGRELGMRTVAEGIERPEQAEALRQWGCTHGQGYLFSRPLPPAEIEALLARLDEERRDGAHAAVVLVAPPAAVVVCARRLTRTARGGAAARSMADTARRRRRVACPRLPRR